MLMNMEPVRQQPAQPAARPATPPVMDVVPPRPLPAEPLRMPPQDNSSVPVAAPKEVDKKQAKKDAKAEKASIVKPPKGPKSGVGLAVLATIIIVLGLGAMIVYAYLRTNGISVL